MSVNESHIAPKASPPALQAVADQADNPPTSKNQSPKLKNRAVGDHAKSFGYDWKNRADHHKYVLRTGLPEVHAAILNEDWDYAREILCAEDIGLQWLPPVSQRTSPDGLNETDGFSWTIALPSTDQDKQNRAIVEMAIQLAGTTSVAAAGCLYGANLLTLCLQLPTPADFTQRVIELAEQHAPVYLSLPDASGRTPLYIAIERQDADQVRALLDAGADPFMQCQLAQGEVNSAYLLAMKQDTDEFFSIFIEKYISIVTTNDKYSIEKDYLSLKEWVVLHEEKAIEKLADRFNVLRDALFNYPNKSGTNLVYQHLIQGKLPDIEIIPLVNNSLDNSPLHAAAMGGPADTYIAFLKQPLLNDIENEKAQEACMQSLTIYFRNRSTDDVMHLIEQAGEVGPIARSHLLSLLASGNLLPEEQFIALSKLLWPRLSDAIKNQVFVNSAAYSESCFNTMLQMMDCSLYTLSVDRMLHRAAMHHNKAAWEFAADRSFDLGRALASIRRGEIKIAHPTGLLQMLMAGSLKWFDAFLGAGIDFQNHIDVAGDRILPRLADLDPAGLKARLTGYRLPVDQAIPTFCETSEGRLALEEMMRVSEKLH